MLIEQASIPGCYQIFPQVRRDNRGSFVKTFHQEVFEKNSLRTDFAEEYYSLSHKGVLRGLHFQTPPHEHVKLISCLSGKVLDAIVDLRVGSPTYRKFLTFEMSAEQGNMIYLAPGIAHGFYALTDNVIMHYKVTTVYAQEHDAGIKWNSTDIPWPDSAPTLSKRDLDFPSLAAFQSPFEFENGKAV